MWTKKDSFGMRLLSSFLVLVACAALSVAQAAGERGGNRGADRSGGADRNAGADRSGAQGNRANTAQANNAKADARSNNVRNTSANNVNGSNRNTNVNKNVNVNVDSNNGGCCNNNGWDNDHPVAAVAATVAVTSAIVGSLTPNVPANCVPVNYGGMVYQQCGNTWYQPQGSQYVVVNPPY
ncbi:MAG TPA: hypothetical protein VHQ87_05350 [Rhizobacter sp.]|jgi:hypothetical protein|nr:hypothetical protein [Rhizobacter sp.]